MTGREEVAELVAARNAFAKAKDKQTRINRATIKLTEMHRANAAIVASTQREYEKARDVVVDAVVREHLERKP